LYTGCCLQSRHPRQANAVPHCVQSLASRRDLNRSHQVSMPQVLYLLRAMVTAAVL
jgi:hypothetical protein